MSNWGERAGRVLDVYSRFYVLPNGKPVVPAIKFFSPAMTSHEPQSKVLSIVHLR